MQETYKTITQISTGLFKDKGSRFISYAIPVKSAEDAKTAVEEFKKKYHDARHHCYAYMIGPERKIWRANDDGEPSGTAGKPILGQINSFGLTDILIVVIRYFGGTLLGTSGLINAYKSAANDALINAKITESHVKAYYRVEFPYIQMNAVMKIIKDEDLDYSNQEFGNDCSMVVSMNEGIKDKILGKLNHLEDLKVAFIKSE
jgi:uncharacterized YigZ family protein